MLSSLTTFNACFCAYGYAASKMSNAGSPVKAIPSKTINALVTNAKYSGTQKGYLKNISLSSVLMAVNFFLLRETALK